MMVIRRRVCFVATVEIAIKAFLVSHFKAMESQYDITVVTNTKDVNFLEQFELGVKVIPLRIEREVSPIRDLAAVFRLFLLFRKYRFDAVHSIMPKSGLLSMVAAFFARTPVRIHAFTGQVWATRKGGTRLLLKTMDRLLSTCATHILVDSPSQKSFLVEQGVVSENKATVIGQGSICGVDIHKFAPDIAARDRIRQEFSLNESDVLFLFLGRLNRDKGVLDLATAFSMACRLGKEIHLLIVGPDEGHMKEAIIDECKQFSSRLHFKDYTDSPQHYMAAADVLCLPSYREGFGLVVVEAASIGLPSIGSRIYGITDAILDGVTGFLHSPGNTEELAARMTTLINDRELRTKMGERARKRAHEQFSQRFVISEWMKYYRSVLDGRPRSQ